MATSRHVGRHRAAGGVKVLAELGAAVRNPSPSLKASGALAAVGGLAAALAMPSAAATPVAAPAVDAAAPVARAAVPLTSVERASRTTARTSVTAPTVPAAVSSQVFGAMSFTAVAKPKPKPKPKPVVVQAPAPTSTPSTSATSSTASAPSTPAPAPKAWTKPANGGVLAIAASLSGIPYLWGGTSPSTGFDCSGFTQYVFRQVGISLPRTAEQQRQFVTPVSNPQPGDLIFTGIPAWHVGIYAGNGMMYDSPTTGKLSGLRKIWSTDVTYGRP